MTEKLQRLILDLVGSDGDFDDAVEEVKRLKNEEINLEVLIKLYTKRDQENVRLKDALRQVLVNLHNGSFSTRDVSVDFLCSVPEEVRLSIEAMKRRLSWQGHFAVEQKVCVEK